MSAFKKIAVLVAASLVISTPLRAQTLEKAYILAEPLQYSNQGKFRGCGLNLKVLQGSDARNLDYITVSVNIWLENPGVALVKTALSQVSIGSSSSRKSQPLDSSWIRIKGSDPLIPKKSIPGEDNAQLAIVDLAPSMHLLEAVLEGAGEVQIGFRSPGAKYERIFYGIPKIEQESLAIFQSCIEEFVRRADTDAKK